MSTASSAAGSAADLARALAATAPNTGRAVLRTLGRPDPRWTPGRDPKAVRIPAPTSANISTQLCGDTPHVAVVGGGIAGLAAAVALVERGVKVSLVEREASLGGRVRSWPVSVPGDPGDPDDPGDTGDTGGRATMSRGFHAFFRQYYNLRGLLRRIDPELAGLRPIEDYPLVHADGSRDSFSSIPRRPPWNITGFVAASPSFGLADLARVDVDAALGLLDVDFPATFTAHDGVSAHDVLEGLRFPLGMRDLALEVFARSFFADPREFSGGELVGMFHTYFLGSAEGLLFDVAADDFDRTWWAPLGRYISGRGAHLRCGTTVQAIEETDRGLRLALSDGDAVTGVDAVVLATERTALQRLVADAAWLGDERWREAVAAGAMAPRFVVHRLWFDTPVRPDTAPFLGTAGFGRLDNVSAIHLMEAGAAAWAGATGGSVVELHAYAVPDDVTDEAVLADLRGQLHRLHPELDGARVVHEEVLVRADCPLAGTDPWAARPGVRTPDPRVMLAGDGIRCELPVALMERAATTGLQAANHLLAGWGRAGHDIWSVPTSARLRRSVRAAHGLTARAGALTRTGRR